MGESPDIAKAAGVRPMLTNVLGIAAGGVLSGLGGAALSVDYTRTWAEGILKDRFVVWSGPLKSQDGKDVLPAGKLMATEMLESMQFFVQGVNGTVK
ncbi:MAG: hypothetical protein EOO29_53095 [Comamonadaceae bacterium]|nr:MAG: hypothetical protein EOO29_53095 [Comamonadaceae bacterium]